MRGEIRLTAIAARTAQSFRGLSPIHSLSFAMPAFALGAFTTALTVYLPRFYAGYIGLGAAVVGTSFAIVRLIDIPLDPAIGVIMDRTRTRRGRYRLWLTVGAPLFMLSTYMAFFAAQSANALFLIAWVLAAYIGVSLVTLPHISWASQLAPTYRQRSLLFGVISAVGTSGSTAVLLLATALGRGTVSEAHILHAMGLLIIVATPTGVLAAMIGTPEHDVPEERGASVGFSQYVALFRLSEVRRLIGADFCLALGPQWMSALYLYFFRESRHLALPAASALLAVYLASGLVGAPVLGWMAARIGKHRALVACCTGYSLGLMLLFVMPKGHLLIDAPFLVCMGFLAVGFTQIVRSMVADVGDKVRFETGKNQIGLLYSLITSTQKLGGALAIFFTFNMLPLVGYQTNSGAHNTAAAIHGLELIVLVGPIVFVMLGGLCVVGYPLDSARHADIRIALERRDSGAVHRAEKTSPGDVVAAV
jgi:Na+/melibiose symporter-like transporter